MEDDTTAVYSECHQPIHASDKFCPECGHKVEVVEVVEEVPGETEVLEAEPAPAKKSSVA
jgi:C4-type Zn-finger protein